ncbi:MAG: hypothetical protein ACQEQC_08690 [Elusimicrobiota bacterium]
MENNLKLPVKHILLALLLGLFSALIFNYLRKLYWLPGHPGIFSAIPLKILLPEILREAVMIGIIVIAAVKSAGNLNQKFSLFFLVFGLWDLSFYAFTKILTGWPDSLIQFDILFFLPRVWTGPVLAPVIVSVSFIILSRVLLTPPKRFPYLIIIGLAVILVTFFENTGQFSLTGKGLEFLAGSIQDLKFNWYLFGAGELLLAADMWRLYRKNK